jgi:hypothetical protein
MVPEGIGIFRFPPSRLFSSQLRSARSQLLGQAPSGEGFVRKLFPSFFSQKLKRACSWNVRGCVFAPAPPLD